MSWNELKEQAQQSLSKAPGDATWWLKLGLSGTVLFVLCGTLAWHSYQRAQNSVPLARKNVAGKWQSQGDRFTFEFRGDGSFEKEERETKGPILLTGLGLAKRSGKWQIDPKDDELHFGGIIVKVKRLSKARMVIQFGNKPPVRFNRKAQ